VKCDGQIGRLLAKRKERVDWSMREQPAGAGRTRRKRRYQQRDLQRDDFLDPELTGRPYRLVSDLGCVTIVAADGPAVTATAIVVDAGPAAGARFDALVKEHPNRLRVGLGIAVTGEAVPLSYRQAHLALDAARRQDTQLSAFDKLPFYELILGLAPVEALTMITDSFIGPLERLDEDRRGPFVQTLTVFLQTHGRWERAAARLGVHRHTLHKRITRIERELSVSLDSANVRAGLWFALAARRTAHQLGQ
jgi:DNA-binding PucR family transcriptional regulator